MCVPDFLLSAIAGVPAEAMMFLGVLIAVVSVTIFWPKGLELLVLSVRPQQMFRRRDELYERLHRDHYEIWKALGRPVGWRWKPEGYWGAPMSSLPGPLLSQDEPEWLKEAPELRELLEVCREDERRWWLVVLPLWLGGVVLCAVLYWWLR